MYNLPSYKYILSCSLLLLLIMLAACSGDQAPKLEKVTYSEAIASILYSTDVAGEGLGSGISYLFLVKDDGSISVVKDRGLELNSLIPYQDKLLFHQKSGLVEIQANNEINKIEFQDCNAPSGYNQSSGVLEGAGYHYSLFNVGFTEDMSGYISKIRWGDGKSNYCGEIGSFVETFGNDDESIYLFSGDSVKPEKLNYRRVILSDGKIMESESVEISNMESDARIMFTRFIPYEDRMVGIFSESSSLKLLEINPEEPSAAKIHELNSYPGYSSDYFLYNKDSIHVHDGLIYYADGYGDVYAYDLEEESLNRKFRFENYTRTSMLQDEKVMFTNNFVYFFRENQESGDHLIETYTLDGERKSSLPVKGIKKQIGRDNVHIYDFKMLVK